MSRIGSIGRHCLVRGLFATFIVGALAFGPAPIGSPIAPAEAGPSTTTTTGTLTLAINNSQFSVAVTIPSTATTHVSSANPVTVFVYTPSNATSRTVVATKSAFPLAVSWVTSTTPAASPAATIPISFLAPNPANGSAAYAVSYTASSSLGRVSGKTTSGTVGSASLKIAW